MTVFIWNKANSNMRFYWPASFIANFFFALIDPFMNHIIRLFPPPDQESWSPSLHISWHCPHVITLSCCPPPSSRHLDQHPAAHKYHISGISSYKWNKKREYVQKIIYLFVFFNIQNQLKNRRHCFYTVLIISSLVHCLLKTHCPTAGVDSMLSWFVSLRHGELVSLEVGCHED